MNATTSTMKGYQSALLTRTFALGLPVVMGLTSWAINPPRSNPSGGSGMVQQAHNAAGMPKAAPCTPATQVIELDFNNVRAVIENGGNKWQRRSGSSRPGYEVPKTDDFSGACSIFAGALWMGGQSSSGQLKIAAVLFRTDGNDFWPGPLTNTGDAAADKPVCDEYDRFWVTTRAQAEAHLGWANCDGDPDCISALFPDGYSVPNSFIEWPAMGDVEAGQDLYLAPFFDYDGDGNYDPFSGDYPDYGFETTVEECKNKLREDPVNLFGDYNIYWIFNDKGNTHTETNGQPIGLEVRAQGFAFATTNEINNMTFYNYVVINQGSQTLNNTYFGHFVDTDLGCSNDDFTGCDVRRGLGYTYNWDDNDENCLGSIGYGAQPPAVGVDFFEGPYQDADNVDNPGPEDYNDVFDCQQARDLHGIPYKGIGIGYGDDIIDNERFGMRAFLYFNREGNANVTDPQSAQQFYNYLRSIWKNNRDMSYGGTGYSEAPGAIRAYYMFPDESDPVGWGTDCVPQPAWRELTQTPATPDRRFVQSAGPFTLEPGAYNNITVGVVWARAASGGAFASLAPLRIADDKAQALFDNCFKILDGPDAPDITIRELDRELILYLTNPSGSNNENETYLELDPIIPPEDTAGNANDRYYRFQGYKVYQMANAQASVSDLNDVNLARLVYQGDLADSIGQIINYPFSDVLQQGVPTEMVSGADDGVVHAIRITEDEFAQGDARLVNFKTYYYIAIAYGYNNYEDYNPAAQTGQAFPYVEGRKGAFGAIRSYSGIPHKPNPQDGGTTQNAQFGDGLPVTRLEGQGNGNLIIELDPATENAIVSGAPWREDELTYRRGFAPIDVRVVDPLKIPNSKFEIGFADSITPGDLDDAYWWLVNLSSPNDTIYSDRTVTLPYEQLFLDWGFSVAIGQAYYDVDLTVPLGPGSMTFADPNKVWLTGIPDADGANPFNWIRSGPTTFTDAEVIYNDRTGKDDGQLYEGILGGTWCPWPLAGQAPFQPSAPSELALSMALSKIKDIPSIQVVITADKNKWTRCIVFEQEADASLAEGGAARLAMRAHASVDKNGLSPGMDGCNVDEATLFGEQPTGAGWFPGYAIDLENGERLNMAFGENSFWGGEIGRDMIWNPSAQLTTQAGEPYFGGCHWIYVWKNDRRVANNADRVPKYDEARYIYTTLPAPGSQSRLKVMRGIGWVGSAMLVPGQELLSTDVRIRLNVAKPYEDYTNYNGAPEPIEPTQNNGLPLYMFGTDGYATLTGQYEVAESFLDEINIVPNPYYAFSGYETSRLDNRVKFINLPQRCTISIYTVSGTLVRKFRKDNELTYLDWDLKNTNNIPIAGGVYICHVDVPGVGEKVIKWFGALRPLDLQNF